MKNVKSNFKIKRSKFLSSRCFFSNIKTSKRHVNKKIQEKNDFKYLTTLFQYYIISHCKCNFNRKIEIVCQGIGKGGVVR